MSGIKTLTQFDCHIPATNETNFVRLKELREELARMTSDVDHALTATFAGTYDPAQMTLTQSVSGALVIDGVQTESGDRLIVTAQSDATQNGVYTVSAPGNASTAAVLTRAADFNASRQFINGMVFRVAKGDMNAGTRWRMALGAIPFVLDAVTVGFAKEVVDFTKVVQILMPIEGDAATTTYRLDHGWNTENILHEVYEDATGETVITPPLKRVSPNSVEIVFTAPLGNGNDYVLVLHAEVSP